MKNNNSKLKILCSAVLGAMISVVFVTVATIYGELNSIFKDWLKVVFYHHWIGKGAISIILFIFASLAFYGSDKDTPEEKDLEKNISILVTIVSIGAVAIIGFYVFEAFFAHQG